MLIVAVLPKAPVSLSGEAEVNPGAHKILRYVREHSNGEFKGSETSAKVFRKNTESKQQTKALSGSIAKGRVQRAEQSEALTKTPRGCRKEKPTDVFNRCFGRR